MNKVLYLIFNNDNNQKNNKKEMIKYSGIKGKQL